MNTINGRKLGHANNVTSMAFAEGRLYGATGHSLSQSGHDLLLWRGDFFESPVETNSVAWKRVTSVDNSYNIAEFLAIASSPSGEFIYYRSPGDDHRIAIILTPDDLQRHLHRVGFVDYGETQGGIVAMAGARGPGVSQDIYAATNNNLLWLRPAIFHNHSWDIVGHAYQVVSMSALDDPDDRNTGEGWLLAASNDGNIGKIWMRDDRPFDMNWAQIADFGVQITAITAAPAHHWSTAGHPNVGRSAPGSVEIVGLVYTATANNELWVAEVPRPPWPSLRRGRIRTADEADLIEYTVEPNAVDGDNVEFVLTLGGDVTWRKELTFPLPLWRIVAEGNGGMGRSSLSAHQIQNGQPLTFSKAKKGGEVVGVHTLGQLDSLSPGSRVTFQWVKD